MVVSAFTAGPASSVECDAARIRARSQLGPRYRSYPASEHFTESFGYRDYLQALAALRLRGNTYPLSLYVHVPFAEAASGPGAKGAAGARTMAAYLNYLKAEIAMQGRLFDGMNQIDRMHLGGGAPTCLSDAQLGELMAQLRRWFSFAPQPELECSIEADVRSVTRQRLPALRALGFNCIGLSVREADARSEPEKTAALVAAARAAGFRSVRIELFYGLPGQTVMSTAHMLAGVIAAGPDQVALRSYMQWPRRVASGAGVPGREVPDSTAQLDMLSLCGRRLAAAGYVHVGLDHFARPTDALALAQRHGCLHRTFQGYSTHAQPDLVAFGVSAIGAVGATYSQNVATLEDYYDRIDRNELPIARGVKLSMDDAVRRSIIQMLMCNFELSIAAIEQAYPITFASYFAEELEKLNALARAGWLSNDGEWLSVNPARRVLVRHICMVFDRYLKHPPGRCLP
ncbi:MAG: oxygen-independent coproporphyrinogen III oxidase [Telluria sp.]|nr:oxygen-independent coproporphyrinogen III oxidase [Telluria sp.]